MGSRCLFITVFFTRQKCVYTQKKLIEIIKNADFATNIWSIRRNIVSLRSKKVCIYTKKTNEYEY